MALNVTMLQWLLGVIDASMRLTLKNNQPKRFFLRFMAIEQPRYALPFE
jgi:hypothetical protein